MHDWIFGSGGRWVSMGLSSDGSYGIPEGLICGVPAICEGGSYRRVTDLPIDEFSRTMINLTVGELSEELAAARTL